MAREGARDRASRLLVEGRVIVTSVGPDHAEALVRGEGVVHRARLEGGVWTCSCPVRSPNCSHLYALRRVIAVDLPEHR